MAQATTTSQNGTQMGTVPDTAAQSGAQTKAKPAGQMGQTHSGAPKMGDTDAKSGQMGGTASPLFTDWASI